MGLDMWLYAERHLSEFREGDKEIADEVGKHANMPGRIAVIRSEILYWRKMNAIHTWFVQNYQDGVDDCRDCRVPIDAITKLRDVCRQVLAERERAEELLPTSQGFFFGNLAYDEWYFNDVEFTEQVLTQTLDFLSKEDGVWYDFIYSSSW